MSRTYHELDYNELLSYYLCYKTEEINASVIKYYQAVQQITETLLEKIEYFEDMNKYVFGNFNDIRLKLRKKYKRSNILSEDENTLLNDRQRYFESEFSLDMNSVKSKLLAVKHQADKLELKIDEINSSDDSIRLLALLEKEDRASIELIAENVTCIVNNAFIKIEYFENHHDYIEWVVNAWEHWSEQYKIFRTTYYEEMKSSCAEDEIKKEIWQKWYAEWQSIRFRIEQKFQPMVEHELRHPMKMNNGYGNTVSQRIIAELTVYRNAVDTFYREERKSIYQSFAFQSCGDIQDKLESESKLYKLTADFQKSLQNIVFDCAKSEDRIFILKWANDLLDIQIDEILEIISDNDLDKVSETLLSEFSELKKKNYEIYLADAKSYGEEQASRDKQFNSLLFKMRNGLK